MIKITPQSSFRLLWKLVIALSIVFLISLFIILAFALISFQGIASPEEFTQIKKQVIIGGVLIFIFFVSASFALAEAILSPLRHLIERAKKISAGNIREVVVVNSQDELQDLAKIFNDLTSLFHETLKREKAISEMKSDFLRIVAHQLRTPLSAIKWAFDTILSGDTGEISIHQRELLMKAYRKSDELIALIRDILDVVRIEEGKFIYNPQRGRLEEIVEKIIADLLPLAQEKDIKLQFQKPEFPLPPFLFDARNMKLALENIIGNAVHYTPREGTVTVSVQKRKQEIIINIDDMGIGIPKKEQHKLFTKFFRASNAVRLETEGNGLGLFITKNIIEKHGGRIIIKSEEGKGTHVSVSLPLSRTPKISDSARYQKFIKNI